MDSVCPSGIPKKSGVCSFQTLVKMQVGNIRIGTTCCLANESRRRIGLHLKVIQYYIYICIYIYALYISYFYHRKFAPKFWQTVLWDCCPQDQRNIGIKFTQCKYWFPQSVHVTKSIFRQGWNLQKLSFKKEDGNNWCIIYRMYII